jgi:hypothetical protein
MSVAHSVVQKYVARGKVTGHGQLSMVDSFSITTSG